MAAAASLDGAARVITPRHPLWRSFALVVALSFRLLPRRARFPLVLGIARVVPRAIGRFLSRRAKRQGLSLPRDEVSRLLARALMDGGTMFTPRIAIERADALPAGALIVAAHYPLNALVISHLKSLGRPVTVVKAFQEFDRRIWGSGDPYEVLEARPGVLLTMQRRVRSGRLLFVHADHHTFRTGGLAIQTSAGVRFTEPTLFAFARRCALPLFFAGVRIGADGVPALILRAIEGEAEFVECVVESWGAGIH